MLLVYGCLTSNLSGFVTWPSYYTLLLLMLHYLQTSGGDFSSQVTDKIAESGAKAWSLWDQLIHWKHVVQSASLCFTSKDFLFIYLTECILLTSFLALSSIVPTLTREKVYQAHEIIRKIDNIWKTEFSVWNYKHKLDFSPFWSQILTTPFPSPSLPLLRNEQRVG